MGNRSSTILLILASVLGGAWGCGEDKGVSVAAVSMDSGRFGALMAATDGTQFLPIVDRDPSGAVIAARGALWMNSKGSRIAVMVDPATGLPSRTVMGDLVLVFGNWNTKAGTVDIATIYGPTGYVALYRGVAVPGAAPSQASGVVSSAMTCFPACETPLKNLSEMLKIGFTSLSIGGCIAATVGTWGAMALPCAGALVSAASLVTPDDLWLDDVDQTGRILALTDALKCTRGDAGSCVGFFGSVATEAMDLVDSTLATQAPLIAVAEEALGNPAAPAGVVQGAAPVCAQDYECTPGAYLPCYPEGTKQCGQSCKWAKCPASTGGGSCSINTDSNEVCGALVDSVTAQCAAKGGHIIAWAPDQAACVEGYDCWKGSCPCLMTCSEKCAADTNCALQCMADMGEDAQAAALRCAACPIPEVKGQCQTGG
jgi:hypothetical protein